MDGEVVTAASAVVAQPAAKAAAKPQDDESSDDDDDDLAFDDDDDDKPAAKPTPRKQAASAKPKEEKKPKKVVIAKSNLVLDVKPLSDETDLALMEAKVRAIEMKGLTWGDSKLVDIAYGLKKLQIGSVLVDEEVSVDDLEENILNIPDPADPDEGLVQSVDTVSFTKI